MTKSEKTRLAALPARAVIELSGPDRVMFLQGLVSNDVAQAAPGKAVWTGFLSPQGKYLADFFILSDGERLYLDAEAAQVEMLIKKLGRLRLRADVALAARSDLLVHAAWPVSADLPVEAPADAIVAQDPRLPAAGLRLVSTRPLPTTACAADWDAHRLSLGLPDGTRDLEPEKTVLLEAGFDELHGISWTKGCYMGQELTARTRYRGLVKRRLVPVVIDGELPPPGSPVMRDGQEVGTMRSGRGVAGLAVLRLEALPLDSSELGGDEVVLESNGASLRAHLPAWFAAPRLPPTR